MLNDTGASGCTLKLETDFHYLDKTAESIHFQTPSGAVISSKGYGLQRWQVINEVDSKSVDLLIPTFWFPDMPDELSLTSAGTLAKGGLYMQTRELHYTNLDGTIKFKFDAVDSGKTLGYLFPWSEHDRTGKADYTITLNFETHAQKRPLRYDCGTTPTLAPVTTRQSKRLAPVETKLVEQPESTELQLRFELVSEMQKELIKHTVKTVEHELFSSPSVALFNENAHDAESSLNLTWNSGFYSVIYGSRAATFLTY